MESKTFNKVVIVGLGYVGLPLTCLSSKHFNVIGLDIDQDKINQINNRLCPIDDEYTKKLFLETNLSVTTNTEVLSDSDLIIVCVPTPIDEQHNPNLKPLKNAAETIAKSLKPGSLVIIESTIYPGTTEEVIIPILESSGLKSGRDFGVAYCPERIDPGNNKWVLDNIPRVIGGTSKEQVILAKEFYQRFIDAEIKELNNIKSAEAVKIIENTFRDVNIAFINEIAKSFDKMNIDLIEVIKGASTKPFGFMPFYPGPGVGGHCIPVDPYYLIERAKVSGFDHQFLDLARKINLSMPNYVIEIVQDELNKLGIPIKNTKIGILGCSYKKNIDDVRESPALSVIDTLIKKGAEVHIFDPFVKEKSTEESLTDLLQKVDHIILLTDHSVFVNLNPNIFRENQIKVIIDTKNCLRSEEIKESEVIYRGIGRK